jgi:hypothetical protein
MRGLYVRNLKYIFSYFSPKISYTLKAQIFVVKIFGEHFFSLSSLQPTTNVKLVRGQ